MNRLLFIVNPRAGKGRGARIGRAIAQHFQRDNQGFDLVYTRQSGEGENLARETKADIVAAVGGDGTINEVVNGISGSGKTLAIVPAGSGNDAIRSLAIPRGLAQALDVIRNGVVRVVDTGVISWTVENEVDRGKSHERIFLNGAGMGFDALVAQRVSSIRHLRGTLLYLVAVLGALADFTTPEFIVQENGGGISTGKKLLIAVGNGRCAGGGFYITPRASVDDGVLDLCAIEARNAVSVLKLIPRVLKGDHVGMNEVFYRKGTSFFVSSSTDFAVHVDGEVVAPRVRSLRIRINERSLNIVTPSPSHG